MIDLLLNESFIRSAFPWAAAATPVLALLMYAAGLGRSKVSSDSELSDETGKKATREEAPSKEPLRNSGTRVFLVSLGLLGPVIWVLWVLYESIMNSFGFASVKGLLVVLSLFVVLGLAAGYAARRAASPRT